jgi:hypothetical protein
MRIRVAVRKRHAASRKLTHGLIALSVSAVMAATLGAGAASAKPITVGSPLQGTPTNGGYSAAYTVINSALPEPGAKVTSPVNGTVVDWHILRASGGPFYLVVATHNSNGSYTGTALSTGHSPATTALQTYSTDLPIKAGQTVGLNNSSSSDHVGAYTPAGATLIGFQPPLTPGATGSPFASASGEGAFNAVVQPLPSISKLSPRSASHKGGKKITIKGKNFDGTTKVLFGKKAAKSFKVISDTKIKAVAPAHKAGTVRVTVLNPGRSAKVKASKFKYTP